MTVGEKIRHFRHEKGLTQKQLGELCEPKIAESTIRRYEIGKLNPKIETIQKIAKALDVQYTDLIDIESIKKELDFFELYTSYLKNIGYKITLYCKSKRLIYRLEYDNEYVELSYDEFSTLSYDTLQHIISKLDELIQTKTTSLNVARSCTEKNQAAAVQLHNDDIMDDGDF